ncbi:hypothetical protein ACUXLG_005657 [Ralstonia sp. 121560039-2]|jgi:hypothetical protein|nr:hypothetical protein [Ralstonia insidiosa]MBA9939870.1 hypothetical protein [Ralstonia insidiosa]
MQKVVTTLGKIEHRLRWAAIVVTAVVVAGAIVIPPLWRSVVRMTDDMPERAIAFGRGAEVVVNGKVVGVYGDDVCPDNTTGCLNLSGRSSVLAHLSDGTSELWTIRQEGRRMLLVRPNGEYVEAKL